MADILGTHRTDYAPRTVSTFGLVGCWASGARFSAAPNVQRTEDYLMSRLPWNSVVETRAVIRGFQGAGLRVGRCPRGIWITSTATAGDGSEVGR